MKNGTLIVVVATSPIGLWFIHLKWVPSFEPRWKEVYIHETLYLVSCGVLLCHLW
jgi:hypothetical protein